MDIGVDDLANLIKAVKYENNTLTFPIYNSADNRPAQLLNGRVIEKYLDTDPIDTTSSGPTVLCSSNNDNTNYTNTQVILIGVLPVCLLFVLVVVIEFSIYYYHLLLF